MIRDDERERPVDDPQDPQDATEGGVPHQTGGGGPAGGGSIKPPKDGGD